MKNTGKVVFVVTLITIFTKILTLLNSQTIMAYFGGDDVYFKVYSYAINIPTIIFTIIGTALTTILIPIYSSLLANKDRQRAKTFLDEVITVSSLVSLGLVLLCIVLAPWIVGFAYPVNSNEYQYAVMALRITFTVMFAIGLNFIFQGILQATQHFKLVAAVSLPSIIVMFIYIFFFAKQYGVTGMLYVFAIGMYLQAFFLLPGVLKTGYRYHFSCHLKNADLLEGLRLVPSIALGVSAYQINMLFSVNMSASLGIPSILKNVQDLMLIPVLTLVYSITAVYYPKLSAEWGRGDRAQYKESGASVLSTLVFFLLPATVGLVLLREAFIDLTTKWGKVTDANALLASQLLGFYAASILFIGFKEALDRFFYAQKKTKPSAVVGIVIMATNVILILTFKSIWGVYSIPMAYTCSMIIGVGLLFALLVRSIGGFDGKIYINMLKCLLSASIMGIIVFFVMKLMYNVFLVNEVMTRILKLLLPTTIGAVAYLLVAFVLGVGEVRMVYTAIGSRLKKR